MTLGRRISLKTLLECCGGVLVLHKDRLNLIILLSDVRGLLIGDASAHSLFNPPAVIFKKMYRGRVEVQVKGRKEF